MGAEFIDRLYEVKFIDGHKEVIQCSRFQFKKFIKENKIYGYRILR